MIRTALRFHAPDSVGEACRILAGAGDQGAVVGGGTMLVPKLVRGEATVTHAVHVRRLGLATVERMGAGARIGAAVSYNDLLALPAGTVPTLLTTMAGGITGGAQIRNQGTLGGSASYANPSSDVPACLVALDATLQVAGVDGGRQVRAADFFVGAFRSALRPGEVLTSIDVPDVAVRSGYWKLKLSESSWPIATAAAVATRQADGGWRYRVALGAVSATPVVIDVSGLVDGSGRLDMDGPAVEQLVRAAVDDALIEPWADELAPATYRSQVAAPVARRALTMLQKETQE